MPTKILAKKKHPVAETATDLNTADVLEQQVLKTHPKLLEILLVDHTTKKNIVWGSNHYKDRGPKYGFEHQILVESITKKNDNIIVPRVVKSVLLQRDRTKTHAEVFTPVWLCKKMIDYADQTWIENEAKTTGHPEYVDLFKKHGMAFKFAAQKTWQKYVNENRLELTCGEAPFLVSRYDSVTGKILPLQDRIGILDRKLWVVTKNTVTPEEWMKWAIISFKTTFGFEYQGDSLLLARINLLETFRDYMIYTLRREPSFFELKTVAEIIAWNLWQMNGLTFYPPHIEASKNTQKKREPLKSLFDFKENEGYNSSDSKECLIYDWELEKPIRFSSLKT